MEIPKRNRWDGGIKNHTKNCGQCEFYRKIGGNELCGWGIAFKYLVQPKKMKECEVKNRDMKKDRDGFEETHSIKYLDKITKEGILTKENDRKSNELDRKTQAKILF